MKRFFVLALLMGLFAGFVGCGSEEGAAPKEEPAAGGAAEPAPAPAEGGAAEPAPAAPTAEEAK